MYLNQLSTFAIRSGFGVGNSMAFDIDIAKVIQKLLVIVIVIVIVIVSVE